MNKVTCLVCHKYIEKIHEYEDSFNLNGGGYIKISFGYGSKYDKGFEGGSYKKFDEMSRLEKLSSCDIIRGYICDSCFEENSDVLEGYKLYETVEQRKVVDVIKH